MAQEPNDRVAIREYLLGQLPDSQLQDFEQRLVSEDTAFEELLVGEDDLIDAYLKGELDAEQKDRFESIFSATSERQDKLRFGRAFMNYVSLQTADRASASVERPTPTWWRQFASPARIVAYALLIVGVAVASWLAFFRQSDVDKGLIALNDAYRQQRPVEARISQLDYAPFSVMRGAEPERVDSLARDRAERILLDAVHNKPGAESYHALGKLYLAKKDFDRAIAQFEEGLKADPNNAQIYADLGAALLEKGKLELERGRSDRASSEAGKGLEDLGRSLENLSKALPLNPNLLEALFNRALCHQYMMLLEQAEDDWREYLKKDSTSQWAEEARQNLKLLEEQKKRTSQTQGRLFDEFLAAYASHDAERAWIAISHSRARTGNALVERLLDDSLQLAASGRVAEAEEQFQKLSYVGAIESERVGDKFNWDLARFYKSVTREDRAILMQARRLMRSGGELYNKAEYTDAITTFSKARELFSQITDEGEMLFAEAWTGYCYLRIPDLEKSGETFQRLSKIFETKHYRSLFAQSLLAEADALNAQNEFSKVLEQANRALAVSEQIDDHANAIRCLQANTSMQLILGNYLESLTATFQALSLAEALPPDPKLRWPFYHEASLDFYLLGMPGTALQFEDEALRLATSANLPLHASRSYDRRAFILEGLHKYAEAIKSNEQAVAEGEKIIDERARTNVLAHAAMSLGDLYKESHELPLAIESYDRALKLSAKLNLNIYQYRAHKGKLLALIAMNRDGEAESELETVLYWFEQNREKIAEESYRNKFFDTDQNTYDIAVNFEYSRKKDTAKAFDYAEAYRARSLLDLISTGARANTDGDRPDIKLSSASSPLALSQIQERLPKGAQLLEYAVLDDKILIWVITGESLKSAQSNVSRSELDEKISGYLRSLSETSSSDHRDSKLLATDLYATLIKPVEGYLNREAQLCIIPDGSLNFLPFAALVSQSGKYLIEDFTLETSPSATSFILSSDQASLRKLNGAERLLVVGNPYFDRQQFNLPDLPAAQREAVKIAEIYGARPILGAEALAPRVKSLLRNANVAHFATHALPDQASPLLSRLVLSRGSAVDAHHASPGFLQASEIYALKLPHARLVVLSACQTGIERAYRGEGAIGLARPFIAAGVPLVVASLWPVESEGAADLMVSFHKHRKQDHVSTVEALRRAQLEYLHNEWPNSRRDFGWAAFVTIGGYAAF